MTLPPDPLPPQPGFWVGIKEVYDAVQQLKAIVERQTGQQDEHGRDLADHESRLRTVEAAQPALMRADLERLKAGRWPLPTITALCAVGALVAAILTFIYRTH